MSSLHIVIKCLIIQCRYIYSLSTNSRKSSDKKIANEEAKHKLREGLRQQSLSKLITLAYYIIVQRKKIILSLFSFLNSMHTLIAFAQRAQN